MKKGDYIQVYRMCNKNRFVHLGVVDRRKDQTVFINAHFTLSKDGWEERNGKQLMFYEIEQDYGSVNTFKILSEVEYNLHILSRTI